MEPCSIVAAVILTVGPALVAALLLRLTRPEDFTEEEEEDL
jgi:hypothetical protein